MQGRALSPIRPSKSPARFSPPAPQHPISPTENLSIINRPANLEVHPGQGRSASVILLRDSSFSCVIHHSHLPTPSCFRNFAHYLSPVCVFSRDRDVMRAVKTRKLTAVESHIVSNSRVGRKAFHVQETPS